MFSTYFYFSIWGLRVLLIHMIIKRLRSVHYNRKGLRVLLIRFSYLKNILSHKNLFLKRAVGKLSNIWKEALCISVWYVQCFFFIMGRNPVEPVKRVKYKPTAMWLRGECYTKNHPFIIMRLFDANVQRKKRWF